MSDTPLYDTLRRLRDQGFARFHMPGHKGDLTAMPELGGIASIDFTELDVCGVPAALCIHMEETDRLAASYFGASACKVLCGGATQGLFAALYLCRKNGKMIFDRGSHLSAHRAAALLDIDPSWIVPEICMPFGVYGRITEWALETAIRARPDACAVLITSPTYYGVRQDIAALSDVVKRYGMKLIVDEAHGAHFPALPVASATGLGADIAVSSAHKTLPALTPGAFLYSSAFSYEALKEALAATCSSTSPSYPVLASCEAAIASMSGALGRRYRETAQIVRELCGRLNAETPFVVMEEKNTGLLIDPCRIVIHTARAGITGVDAAKELYKNKIVPEFAERQNMVFITGGMDKTAHFERLYDVISAIEPTEKADVPDPFRAPPVPEKAASPRRALFAEKEPAALGRSAGRVAGAPIAPYPPGIPVVWAGEVMNQVAIEYLLQKGYNEDDRIMLLKE